ncbi:MAG: TonB-dependent receptor [Bryobacteraceae bacterium]|nr:carboxypeptidase regulatory-like domain-containing protein [Bryobacterales bacterium]MEB2360944.1 carboxypeptidase regulatory-like domain-containing protein [Bryobacterales bacterium]NUN02844.1 TonB-dependent receptor [Bryobacteraceae bacterium]
MKHLGNFQRVCLAPALAMCFAALGHGQATQGSILGNVTDATGATVPGAVVTIRNEGTNFTREVRTDDSGDYRVSGLEPGNYEVTITNQGFKTFKQTKVDVVANQIKRINAALEVGDVSTTVTVEGGTAQVETETATLSNVKTSRDFTELPLSIYGRGWANITNVTAGIQSQQCCAFLANGARGSGVNFTTDGIYFMNTITSSQGPNGFSGEIEFIQEVKVMTANNSAEFAQVSQFAAVSKAGTNELHGSLYWGNFNNKFSARQWQDTQKPEFTNHNMFAITNGGPVYIPRLYDGRNKTFYFFSYGGARYRVGSRTRVSLPTPAFRQGDFSSIANLVTIVDPLNGQPFANNRIPANRISPVSAALQDIIYPDPNQPGLGDYGLTENFYADPGGRYDSDVYSIRGDQKISDKNFLYSRVGLTINNKDSYPGPLKDGYGPGAWQGNHPARSVVISDTHTFSPAVVNEVKLGYSRDFGYWFDTNYGRDVLSQIGLQGISNPGNDPAIGGMPSLSFGGSVGFAGTDTWANGNFQAQNTYQLIDNISWYRGRHNLKMGFDVRWYQINDQSKPQSMRGAFSFDDQLSGFNYANFLLGYPSFATRSIARPNAYPRSSQYMFYAQDDFKVSPRVTLNYGLRYEYQTPWVEKFDRMFKFDPTRASLVTAGDTLPTDLVPAVAATLPIISAAEAGYPVRSLMKTDSNNITPRLGLAVRPFSDASTVVRLGWGLYSQMWPGSIGLGNTGGPWQSQEVFFIEGNTPAIRFPNPFLTTSEFAGLQSVRGLSPSFPTERTQQWSASFGRQIWQTAVDIAYVGTSVKNIPYTEDLNLLAPSTIPYNSARRPYQLFNSVNFVQTGGSSIYHGLTVTANRRMGDGLWYNVNYTWAKALTDTDLGNFAQGAQQNQYQRFLERADEQRHRRHQLRFSYVYELPVGRGKPLGGNIPAVANWVIGNWNVSGITTFLTGQVLSPAFSGTDPANTNQYGGRPDRIRDGNFDSGQMRDRIKSREPIFDSSAFVRPETGRGFYGNSARYILIGPGQMTWNTVLSKNFPIAEERARLQFRWEMFNALNRPNFYNPNTNLQSGAFGLVTGADSARSMLFGLRLDY